jgi:hypothetical protein
VAEIKPQKGAKVTKEIWETISRQSQINTDEHESGSQSVALWAAQRLT